MHTLRIVGNGALGAGGLGLTAVWHEALYVFIMHSPFYILLKKGKPSSIFCLAVG